MTTVEMRSMEVAAFLTRRPYATIRRWYRTGELQQTACDVRTRQVLVNVFEVRLLHERKGRRSKAA